MAYTDLIFDLYGTLVDIHTEESDTVWDKTAIYCGYYGLRYTGKSLKKDYEQALIEMEAMAGKSSTCVPEIPIEKVFSRLFYRKGVAENALQLAVNAAQLLRIASMEYIRLYPGVERALEAFRVQGARLWLLSNAQHIFTAHELCYLGLEHYFDGIYLSSDYGCRKPDVRFMQTLLTEQQLDVSGCIMIGNDRETDIECAKRVGMDSLYMHTNITPGNQKKANPLLIPGSCAHSEWNGSNWEELSEVILTLI